MNLEFRTGPSINHLHVSFFQLTSIELQYASPKLLECKDLELAVPGTYEPGKPITQIKNISTTLNVITSKQRPRKLSITGTKRIYENILFMKRNVGSDFIDQSLHGDSNLARKFLRLFADQYYLF